MKKMLFWGLCCMLLLLMFSCKTISLEAESEENVVTAGDVTFSIQYKSEEAIMREVPMMSVSEMRRVNPLILPTKGVLQRDLLVFKIKIESEETTLDIRTTEIYLDIEGVLDKSKNVNRYMIYWEGFLNSSEESELRSRLNRLMLPTRLRVEPGEPVEAYIVFFKNFPRGGGPATIGIPATTTTGDSGVVEIPFEFYDPRYGGNTGIFNEQGELVDEGQDDMPAEEDAPPEESIFD